MILLCSPGACNQPFLLWTQARAAEGPNRRKPRKTLAGHSLRVFFSAAPQQREICMKFSVFHTVVDVKFWWDFPSHTQTLENTARKISPEFHARFHDTFRREKRTKISLPHFCRVAVLIFFLDGELISPIFLRDRPQNCMGEKLGPPQTHLQYKHLHLSPLAAPAPLSILLVLLELSSSLHWVLETTDDMSLGSRAFLSANHKNTLHLSVLPPWTWAASHFPEQAVQRHSLVKRQWKTAGNLAASVCHFMRFLTDITSRTVEGVFCPFFRKLMFWAFSNAAKTEIWPSVVLKLEVNLKAHQGVVFEQVVFSASH